MTCLDLAGDRGGGTLGAGCERKSEIDGRREPRIEIDAPPVPLDGEYATEHLFGLNWLVAGVCGITAQHESRGPAGTRPHADHSMRDGRAIVSIKHDVSDPDR